MEDQWSPLVKPGQKVKVKIKDDLMSVVVEQVFFISKLSLIVGTFMLQPKLMLVCLVVVYIQNASSEI